MAQIRLSFRKSAVHSANRPFITPLLDDIQTGRVHFSKSATTMSLPPLLLHVTERRRVPVDPVTVFFLEADGDDTLVRISSSRRKRDSRAIGELARILKPYGFVRIHRSYVVNINRIREIRKRKASDLWELRLEPPVNRILPVSETYLKDLWAAFSYGDKKK